MGKEQLPTLISMKGFEGKEGFVPGQSGSLPGHILQFDNYWRKSVDPDNSRDAGTIV